ncbi:MAG TPA: hypothetical protein VHG72_07055 [Polyangia bacterium]|nr:hypothetical protein [Polyangia bacterium]
MKHRIRGPGRTATAAALLLVGAAFAVPARADDANKSAIAPGELASDPAFSLDPASPQVGALPGGVTPSYGQRSLSEEEWRFDFHGFLTAPLDMGINTRKAQGVTPGPGQSNLVLHAPPVVPDDLETFEHTGVVPTTYAQLNFSESNSIVSGNVSIQARQANVSESFLEPASQLGITDAYLTLTPPLADKRYHLGLAVGAFSTRYGSPGEYDEGRYGTPLIARINGVGELGNLRVGFGDWVLMIEEGLHGQTNKASAGITPDVWNNFADPGTGSTFVAHAHVGLAYARHVTIGAHAIRAFSLDDRDGPNAPDGRINIFAGDLRLGLGRFGQFYAAYAYTNALQARNVSRIVSVLNTQGGPGLMDEYFGPNSGGTGTLNTLGGQYDLSIGRLVSYPVPFSGDGPDLVVSAFGLFTHVTTVDAGSWDPNPPSDASTHWNGANKLKVGGEATYSMLSWFAAALRFDHVAPFLNDSDFSFNVVTSRIILHSDWQSSDQIVIQYSHWFNGPLVAARDGEPPTYDFTTVPDANMFSISASMWW